ncbi:UDP-glucuronosyltransferase 2A2-like [Boleophthalmus pectinirostris]|uniref:UDP-glucuronosyltransferase 2A2-like n=1 Tax=Boleophthalmus pectinirostris TaxID=150288 RepID=UPI00242E7945|nr:UDP-glucuronosyltransferase 2A2-like [Boleophthalmus pectinirostris]
MKVLVEALSSKGHNITVLRPVDSWFIKESPNYTTINIPAMSSNEKIMTDFAAKMTKMSLEPFSVWEYINRVSEVLNYFYQKHQSVVNVVREMFENNTFMQELREAKFDLVLTDPAVLSGVLMAHRLELPLVLVARWTMAGDGHSLIAPSLLSYIPMPSIFTDKMTFSERVKNMLQYFLINLQILNVLDSNYNPIVQHYFGSDIQYSELVQAADIWLMRIDFTFEFPRPTMPNIVYIAGYPCKPPKPLPHNLEDFVQSSGEHGVVIMSLGTLVAQLPDHVVEEIAAAFSKLPQKVIWRHKGKRPVNLGNNTLLSDWLPQSDLLGHPKTKVFVGHGGTNGIQEAIYHGVPLVGLPLMHDQRDNFGRMEVRGVAKVLDIATLNRDNFLQALQEVLYNPSYREKMKILSKIHRDTPLNPLDTAVFWVEFVMKHKGAKHLRSESYKLSFLQYHCIDVIVFLIVVTLLCVAVVVAVLNCLWRLICNKGKLKKQ